MTLEEEFSAKAVLFERSKTPDRCVVANCNNTVDKLGMVLAVHTIPFFNFGDLICALKQRNGAKIWVDFVETKRAQR